MKEMQFVCHDCKKVMPERLGYWHLQKCEKYQERKSKQHQK